MRPLFAAPATYLLVGFGCRSLAAGRHSVFRR